MEGQNKRTEVVVECVQCGDTFTVPVKDHDEMVIEDVGWIRCPDCLENVDV